MGGRHSQTEGGEKVPIFSDDTASRLLCTLTSQHKRKDTPFCSVVKCVMTLLLVYWMPFCHFHLPQTVFFYFTFLLISHDKIENTFFRHVDKRLKNHPKNSLLQPSGAKWYNWSQGGGWRLAAKALFDVRRCEATKAKRHFNGAQVRFHAAHDKHSYCQRVHIAQKLE